MSESAANLRRVKVALESPAAGVVGLVDVLLAVSLDESFSAHWHDGRCRLAFSGEGQPEASDIVVPKSVFRAVLARVAALCNERRANSVTPCRGAGEVAIDGLRFISARFVNTPDELSLDLSPAPAASPSQADTLTMAAVAEKLGPLTS